MIKRFKDFLQDKASDEADGISTIKSIVVELSSSRLEPLDEATRATVGRYTARRDQPHFQGDEKHAHVELPGGYEVAWSASGKRRHENKFPARVPKDAKAAVAKALNVKADVLEEFRATDMDTGEPYWLLVLTEGDE